MAIIRINTVGDGSPPQPTVPSLQEGVPLDFEFYARRTYGHGKGAVQKALRAIQESTRSPHTESVATRESVVSDNLRTNPCLYAEAAAIQANERVPDRWLPLVNQRRELIQRVLRSVGRIQLYHATRELGSTGAELGIIIGTGFVVAPGVVMTNRHVAELFGKRSAGGWAFRPDGLGEFDPVVHIDFAGVYEELPELCRITKILYVAPEEGVDVALLQFAPHDGEGPPPLPLQTKRPDDITPPRDVFACGYPTSNTEGDPRVPKLFRMLRVKRVSLGEFQGEARYEGRRRLFHTCTTLGGSSGSPVVDFETGTVWGVHFFGKVQERGNLAEPLWRVVEVPKVRALLGNATLGSSPELPPLDRPSNVIASQQVDRPVLFAGTDDLAAGQAFPSRWLKRNSPEHRFLRSAISAVGLISVADPEKKPSDSGARGTGFLVAPDILMTMGQVVPEPGDTDAQSGSTWERLVVDFARSGSEASPLRVGVLEILFSTKPQLALIKLRRPAQAALPAPLPLQSVRPDKLATERVFVVGHPLQNPSNPEGFSLVFPPPWGVKRVALGEVMEDRSPGEPQFFHDCSTSVGDGGAPVVSLATGRVLGIHLGGNYRLHNFAFPIWEAMKIPAARAALEGTGTTV